jgi:hypothetical protein
MRFYCDANDTGLPPEVVEDCGFKGYSFLLIDNWLKFPEPRRFFADNVGSPEILKFMRGLLPAIEAVIKRLAEGVQVAGVDRQGLGNFFTDLKSYLEFLQTVARVAPAALALPGQEHLIPRIVIFGFDRFARVEALKDISGRWKEFGYTPTHFLVSLIIIAVHTSANQELLPFFTSTQLGYGPGLYEEIARFLERLTFEEHTVVKSRFAKFIECVNKAPALAPVAVPGPVAPPVAIPQEEVPGKFTDFTTGELMHDPVLLKSNGLPTRVDRSTLPTLNNIHPVTNDPLRPEDIMDDAPLKQEIEAWVASWRLSHRK